LQWTPAAPAKARIPTYRCRYREGKRNQHNLLAEAEAMQPWPGETAAADGDRIPNSIATHPLSWETLCAKALILYSEAEIAPR